MPSPRPCQPTMLRIFFSVISSIMLYMGAISYVNMFVLVVAVIHSPASDTRSSPCDN